MTAPAAKSRLTWFDANRACAAVGVVLIHCTTDYAGGVFPDASTAERAVPVILRSIAEFSGSEMFFTFSLWLMAFKLDRRRPEYGPAIREQARRLLVPFAVWTVFYAFFRLVKAGSFGYSDYIWNQLADWKSWAGYFLLGDVQYHMHFLPTLFALFLFYPIMRIGTRYPIFGLVLFATLGAMNHIQAYIWGLGLDPELRDYLIRGTKILGYVGYGFAAFALFGLWKDGIPRGESGLIRKGAVYFAAVAYMASVPFYGAAMTSGHWGPRLGWSFFGHFLMPIFMFAIFMGSQHLRWSPKWSKLARYTFGVYLVHPLLIDLYDVAMREIGLRPEPWLLVVTRFAVVLPLALGLAMLLSRIPMLAWTIGTGPAPWEWGRGRSAALQD